MESRRIWSVAHFVTIRSLGGWRRGALNRRARSRASSAAFGGRSTFRRGAHSLRHCHAMGYTSIRKLPRACRCADRQNASAGIDFPEIPYDVWHLMAGLSELVPRCPVGIPCRGKQIVWRASLVPWEQVAMVDGTSFWQV
jgi:hypothetical protein